MLSTASCVTEQFADELVASAIAQVGGVQGIIGIIQAITDTL
jgi:hypothetical protein